MSEPSTKPLRIGSTVTLAVALVALALSAWAAFRASSEGSREPSYSAEQQAEAKQKVCAATNLVREGVSLNTNLRPAGGPRDVNGTLAVAANARVSLYSGGQYLLARLDPATPPELADAVRKFANNLADIGAAATAGAQNSDPDQAARLREVDSVNVTITELCK
jgi:hypothetical protein